MDRTIHDIPINSIICPPQVRERFDQESLAALAKTMEVAGVQQPISVRRAAVGYELIAGERRWRAAQMAGLTTIPATIIEGELSEADVIEFQLIENCAREDLNPVEKATAYARLMKATQRSAADAARRTGTSPAVVSKLTSLLLLPSDILEYVRGGGIPYSSAYELVKVNDPNEQRTLAEAIVARRLTRDGLIAHTKARANGTRSARQTRRPRAPRERVVIALGEGRSVSVTAPTLSAESIVAWLVDLAQRIKDAAADGRPLMEVAQAVSSGGKRERKRQNGESA